jgi:hypothetical protein
MHPNLRGFWRAENTAIDASGSGFDGTWSGTPGYANGQMGRAFNFTGANTVAVGLALSQYTKFQPFSVCFWVKESTAAANVNSQQTNVANGKGVNIGGGVFRLADGTNRKQVDSSVAVQDGNWHHVACTYSGANLISGMLIYVDSINRTVQTFDQSLGDIHHASPTYLGSRANAGFFMTGLLDEVQIYNAALDANDIRRVMMGQMPQRRYA